MFKPNTASSPEEYIAQIDEPRRQDIQELHDLIRATVPKLDPFMISGMIGYGKYHYKYASGREGDWSIVSLASQKQYISIYIACMVDGQYLAEGYKDKLPKANIGKSCIRFKHNADIDLSVLGDIIVRASEIGGAGQA